MVMHVSFGAMKSSSILTFPTKILRIENLTKEYLEQCLSEKKSICSILKELGYNSNGSGAYKVFKNYCLKIGIDYTVPRQGGKRVLPKAGLAEIFKENSTFAPSHMKRRVIKDGLVPYVCGECGNKGEWNSKPLVLQIDHVNGINTDNRIENLRFLCPNCHTQTKTYSSKRLNKKYRDVV